MVNVLERYIQDIRCKLRRAAAALPSSVEPQPCQLLQAEMLPAAEELPDILVYIYPGLRSISSEIKVRTELENLTGKEKGETFNHLSRPKS